MTTIDPYKCVVRYAPATRNLFCRKVFLGYDLPPPSPNQISGAALGTMCETTHSGHWLFVVKETKLTKFSADNFKHLILSLLKGIERIFNGEKHHCVFGVFGEYIIC